MTLTKHCDLRRLAVPFSDHVGTDADVHAGIALFCVGDHKLPTSNLKRFFNLSPSFQHIFSFIKSQTIISAAAKKTKSSLSGFPDT